MTQTSDKGIITVRRSKKGQPVATVQIEGVKGPMPVPTDFARIDESYNGRECLVTRAKGLITKILIDGKELPKRNPTVPHGGLRTPHGLNRRESPPMPGAPDRRDRQQGDIHNRDKYKLPSDTINALSGLDVPDNFSIFLNHCIPWQGLQRNKDFLKDRRLQEAGFFKLLSSFKERRKEFLKSMQDYLTLTESFSAELDWRMAVGLGIESVHETSLALHHTYGIPYVSGSALKGVARNAAVRELAGEAEELDVMDALISLPDIKKLDQEKKRQAIMRAGKVKRPNGPPAVPSPDTVEKILAGWNEFESARNVFGSQTVAGRVIFLDAFPNERLRIQPDIMNPHYPDYYGKHEPPGDWQSPVPIYFLTIEQTEFSLCLAAKRKYERLLPEAERWLKTALQSFGVGAKTAIGYGYFQIDSQRTG